MKFFTAFHVAAAALTMLPASLAAAADANNGKRLAERWCASCHVIDASQKSASTDAPPFSTVAQNPGFDAAALALFLLHPHPKMPDVGLSRDAAADLAAFILSSRQNRRK